MGEGDHEDNFYSFLLAAQTCELYGLADSIQKILAADIRVVPED